MHPGAVVIGASAGGMDALAEIIPKLPKTFPVPVIIVQHISPMSDNYIATYLNKMSMLQVVEAEEKVKPVKGRAYIAPPNYHLLIERDKTLSLATFERVSFARPSIDVMFETAAEAYGKWLTAIILTGANFDGARGMEYIQQLGGKTIVQDPKTAEVDTMPQSALKRISPTAVVPLNEIADWLIKNVK